MGHDRAGDRRKRRRKRRRREDARWLAKVIGNAWIEATREAAVRMRRDRMRLGAIIRSTLERLFPDAALEAGEVSVTWPPWHNAASLARELEASIPSLREAGRYLARRAAAEAAEKAAARGKPRPGR